MRAFLGLPCWRARAAREPPVSRGVAFRRAPEGGFNSGVLRARMNAAGSALIAGAQQCPPRAWFRAIPVLCSPSTRRGRERAWRGFCVLDLRARCWRYFWRCCCWRPTGPAGRTGLVGPTSISCPGSLASPLRTVEGGRGTEEGRGSKGGTVMKASSYRFAWG